MGNLIGSAFIRGEVVTGNLISFGGRDGQASFLSPDPDSLIDRLPLHNLAALKPLYDLSFDDIVDYLVELGHRLDVSKNEFLQESLEYSYAMTDMTPPLLQRQYRYLPSLFTEAAVREAADVPIGIRYLEGWQSIKLHDGRVASIRAFGSRALHIVAGNSPIISALSIIRNVITRSDAIIKSPSNDPLTSLAIARTMGEMAPDHPISKHLAVAYWKGGSEAFEQKLYRPSNIDKLIAWGGFSSLKHVTRYIQPGLELISLDPKRSATVIGPEAFESEATLHEVALRTATDVGALNQLGCVSARVVYVASGTDDEGLARLDRFGELVYQAMQQLPKSVSTKAKYFDPELRQNIKALRTSGDFYHVIGGESDEGAIIVSHTDEPVDFYPTLSGRVANLVPVDDPLDAVRGMNSYTQTVGVYPEALKVKLRDIVPLFGAQRLVSLGYASSGNTSLPQDAIEPVRRMVKWIVDERCEPESLRPQWLEEIISGNFMETTQVE
jgi:hypothetical protein